MPSNLVKPAILSAALANGATPDFIDDRPERQGGRLHHASFRRVPNDAGGASCASDLRGGDTLRHGASGFEANTKFQGRHHGHSTRDAFVAHHFKHVPHRAPDADVGYSAINASGIVVTGVRSDSSSSDSVVITASATLSTGGTAAALYEGSLQGVSSASSGSWHLFQPVFAGQTVTSSTFYGPNTSLFNPDIGAGNIRAVGSYKYSEGASGPNADHGMIYQGPLSGTGGTWTQIDATSLVTSGTLINTIAHSTMGNLVVGNYDTNLATGHAFIYDMNALSPASAWTELNPMGSASVTAYGIWQNGGSGSTSYTIAGGFSDLSQGGADVGYLVDYDPTTKALTHLKTFNFDNKPLTSLISHFDGITATATGYNLTGDYVDYDNGGHEGAFFASVERLPDGSFSAADWTEIAFTSPTTPNVTATSGNTVIGNNVLGIYVAGSEGDKTTSSYLATVPTPACNWW